MQDKIDMIYATYKDRFIRSGFEWFERLFNMHDTKIIMLNNKTTSLGQELVGNLVSIIHVFSCRLYGLRKYKTKLEKDKSLKGGELNDQNSSS